jgi:superfamily II RNA helicase
LNWNLLESSNKNNFKFKEKDKDTYKDIVKDKDLEMQMQMEMEMEMEFIKEILENEEREKLRETKSIYKIINNKNELNSNTNSYTNSNINNSSNYNSFNNANNSLNKFNNEYISNENFKNKTQPKTKTKIETENEIDIKYLPYEKNKNKNNIFPSDNIYNNNPYNNSNININPNINTNIKLNLKIFPLDKIIKHPNLNYIQENCFDLLFNTNENTIISAPTGSGKTLLFELCICKIVKENFSIEKKIYLQKNFKMIYIGPVKSLCSEKYNEWTTKFSLLNINVTEITGDSEFINTNLLENSNIIIMTPEKFDSLTRKWKTNLSFISSIKLLMIDEIHLLNEETRGATLEAVLTRIKLLKTHKKISEGNCYLKTLRIIGISATIPNINEIAEWLEVKKNCLRIYGEEHRPVKVERIVLGYNMAKNEFIFEKNLNFRLAEVIAKYSDNKPSLVFCQTQKGTINAAMQLMEDYAKLNSFSVNMNINNINDNNISNIKENKNQLNIISAKVKDPVLKNLIKNGISFHNAGLSLEDRQIVEEYFKKGISKLK